jgi:MFS transporter, DHA2 family, multidrug resistance protein
MSVVTESGQKAGRREWIGLGVLLLPLLLVSMDVSVLYFAVPFIARDLAPTSTEQLWIFDVYGFVLAGLLITMGSLGDRIGRRRLLLMGAAAFSLASVAAAYSSSAPMLIGCRAVLGVGGATLMPSTLALIRTMFQDAKQRSTAIAIWTAALTFGVSLGPVLSGFLLEHFWWGSVFLINTPVMVALVVLAPVLVPEYRNPAAGRFDALGSVLSLAAVLPVIYGIKEIAAHGVDPVRVAAIAAGLLLGVVFVRRQRTARHPMIELRMFRQRAFSGSVAANLVAMFGLIGFAIFTTQYLQSVLGMTPLQGALWSLLPSVGVGAAAPLAAQLAQRGVDRAYLVGTGFLLAAAGFAVLTRVDAGTRLWVTLVGAGLMASGLVVVASLATELVAGAAPPERAGTASALLETSSEFGGALGIAVLGSIGTAAYRGDLAGAAPAGVPAGAWDAAGQTLNGALAAAGQLPGGLGDGLRVVARHAFLDGMHTAAVAAVAVMAAAALLSVVILRGAPGAAAPEAAEAPVGALAAARAGVEGYPAEVGQHRQLADGRGAVGPHAHAGLNR